MLSCKLQCLWWQYLLWDFKLGDKKLLYVCLYDLYALYILNPIFHWDLYCRTVFDAERLIFYDFFSSNFSPNFVALCGLCYRAVWITKNFSDPQNLWFIIETSSRSRTDYNCARTVYYLKAWIPSTNSKNF